MARGQSTAHPIQPGDLDQLRERVAAGEAPTAYLLVDTALAAAGARILVLRVDGPEAGDDCVLVRLGDDELPFAPHELSLTPVRRSRQAAASARETTAARSRAPVGPRRAAPGIAPAAVPAPASSPPSAPEPSPQPSPKASPQPWPRPKAPSTPEQPISSRRGGGRPQPLTVTLRFSGTAWTLEHAGGGRKSVAQPVSPAAVRALADRVDDMALRSTLLAAVEQSRQHAAEHAVVLRAQLAAVETVLAELDD